MTGRLPARRRAAGALATVGALGALLLASCSSTPGTSSAAGPGTTGGTSSGSSAGTPSGSSSAAPTDTLTAALTTAAGTEAYALATYQSMVSTLGAVAPWSTIAAAESQHLQTVRALASAHGVTLPSGSTAGASPPSSRTAACTLGVSVEHQVISTYDSLLPRVSGYPDVSRAFGNLRDGAQAHLDAFEHCAS